MFLYRFHWKIVTKISLLSLSIFVHYAIWWTQKTQKSGNSNVYVSAYHFQPFQLWLFHGFFSHLVWYNLRGLLIIFHTWLGISVFSASRFCRLLSNCLCQCAKKKATYMQYAPFIFSMNASGNSKLRTQEHFHFSHQCNKINTVTIAAPVRFSHEWFFFHEIALYDYDSVLFFHLHSMPILLMPVCRWKEFGCLT